MTDADAKLDKFQVLVRDAAVSGIVTWTDGNDLDLQLDACFWRLSQLFPVFGGVIHCEQYGYGDLPGDTDKTPPLAIGQAISLRGAIVLDNTVHGAERVQYPWRSFMRGLFRCSRPKLELHPFRAATIEHDPAPLRLVESQIAWYAATYDGIWLWNRLWCKADRPTGDLQTAAIDVGA